MSVDPASSEGSGQFFLVSIVVPAYNAAETVKETLESLAAQTYTNLEVIIVDDGSRDNTAVVAQETISKLGNKFIYVYQPNAGQAAALNNGWERARGEYLGYLSADDILYPNAVSKIVAHFRLHSGITVIYPDYDLIDAKSKPIRKVNAPEYSVQDLVEKSICQPGPGAIFRKSEYVKTGGWNRNLKLTPDFDFWIRMSQYGMMKRLNESLAGFRVHEGSQSFSVPSIEKSEEPLNVICSYFLIKNKDRIETEYKSGVENSGVTLNERRAKAWAHVLCARLHLRGGRWFRMLSHLIHALRFELPIVLHIRFWHLIGSGALGQLRYRLFSSTKKH